MAFLLGLLLFAAPAPVQKLPEPLRNHPFPGQPRHLLARAGTALLYRYGTPFYTSTLYVDLKVLRSKLPKGQRPTVPAIARTLAEGEVPVLFHTRFLQEASGPSNLRFMHQALAPRWPRGRFDPEAPELAAFNAFFRLPIAQGLVNEVGLDGKGGMAFRTGEEAPTRLRHPDLALAYLRMHFGDAPLDPLFRDSLLLELPARMEAEGLLP
jgi:hypothetical protein